MVLGDLDSYMQKNETRSPTYTIHKNKFKVDKRLKYKFWLLSESVFSFLSALDLTVLLLRGKNPLKNLTAQPVLQVSPDPAD